MNDTPVDLANLRSMTDGDSEMEKALFDEFYTSFEAGITSLQRHMETGAAEAWRKEAHALKGIALNLGAEQLSLLCKNAQEASGAENKFKEALLKDISTEYGHVKKFLHQTGG
jgi:HPt (histidine-containing phosphotransfer) domain-containing protein